MSHKYVWWTIDHMAKICQSYNQEERGSTIWKAVPFFWHMNPLNPTLSHMCQQIPTDHTDSQGLPSLFFSSSPNCSIDHCNCTFFSFFFCAEVSNTAFLKATEKDSMLLWRKSTFFEEQHESQNFVRFISLQFFSSHSLHISAEQ